MKLHRQRLAAGGAGLAAAAILSLSTPAAAHSVLLSSDPPSGGAFPVAQALVLRFAEPVVISGSQVDVLTQDGTVIPLAPLADSAGDRRSLRAGPSSMVPEGPVTLRWNILAEDGHRREGSFPLTALPSPPGGRTEASSTAEPSPEAASASTGDPATAERPADTRLFDGVFTGTRSLGYLSMTLLCGGLAFLALAWPEGAEVKRVRRLLWAAWATGVMTSLAGIGLQAAYAGRLGLGAAFKASVVIPAFDTRVGVAWATRGLLFLLAVPVLVGLARGGRNAVRSLSWRVGTAAVAIGLLRAPGLVGHSSEGRMAWLGSIADLAHLIGVAVWLGGLVLLCTAVLPRRQPEELRRVVSRFSTMAGTSVAVVLIGGSFMSWQLVGSLQALTGTRYGRVLVVKLLLIGLIAAAALLSHRWAKRRLEAALAETQVTGAMTLRPFVLSVATEVALAVAVLTVASVLVTTSPGR